MTIGSDAIQGAVKANMSSKAREQIESAATWGVELEVKSNVYIVDGSKTWPTVLATLLCESPSLIDQTRQALADRITVEMKLTTPFSPTRLSKALTAKAKTLVDTILVEHGYNPALALTGLGIRDAVAAGKAQVLIKDSTVRTKFEADGVYLGKYWYPYERVATYETEQPWYYLGLRFAGVPIALKAVLAMRDIGIGEFIAFDTAAQAVAEEHQLVTRRRLDTAPAC